MGIADEAVGEEVAAPRAIAVVTVVADPPLRAAEVGEHGRGPRKQLVVDDRIDPGRADLSHRPEHATKRRHEPAGGHDEDVLRGDDVEKIEDRPVFGQDHEEDVLPADLLDSRPEGRVSEDGGPLLDELQEQDPFHRPGRLPPIEELAEERQQSAGGEPEPTVGKADGVGIHGAQAQGREEGIINAAAAGIHPPPVSCGCGAPAGAALPLR